MTETKKEAVVELNYKDELKDGSYEILNFDDVKSKLEITLKYYQVKEVSEQNYTIAKSNRTTLNKLSKSVNDKRVKAQKAYLEPFNKGKQQCDELISMIDKVSDELKTGIDAIDNKYKDSKYKELKEYFDSANKYPIDFDKIVDAKWLNKSSDIEEAKSAIDDKLTNIAKDLFILSKAIKKKADFSLLLYFYFKDLDLNKALTNYNDLQVELSKINDYLRKE